MPFLLAILTICSVLLGACTPKECQYSVDAPHVSQRPELPPGRAVTNMPELGDELVAKLIGDGNSDTLGLRERTLIVTTFSDINDLEHTTPFGRTLQEAVMNALIRRGFRVKEVRGAKALNVMPRIGEFILSREPEELPAHIPSQLVITGTISETPTTVIVSLRIVDFKSKLSLSAASMEVIKTPLIVGLLRHEGDVEPLVLDRVNP